MDILEQELLQLLECPVCLEYMVPPIMLCVRGHSVCKNCREQLSNCSLCREKYTETRSVSLENISRKLKYPCKYKPAGCELTFNPEQMAAHQAECEYGRICPLSLWHNCKWRGSYTNMKTHIKTSHTQPVMICETTGKYSGRFRNIRQNGRWSQIVIMQGELFLHCTLTTEDALFDVMMYVGDRDKSKKFKYRIAFTTVDGSKEVTSTLVTPSYSRGIKDIFNKEDCAIVGYNFVKRCINIDNGLPFESSIFEM